MKRQHNILIGERTAEQIKIHVGSALHELDNPPEDYAVHGRDLMTGIPRQIKVSYQEIAHSLDESITSIEEAVLRALEAFDRARPSAKGDQCLACSLRAQDRPRVAQRD